MVIYPHHVGNDGSTICWHPEQSLSVIIRSLDGIGDLHMDGRGSLVVGWEGRCVSESV